jgi:hypothetical protein
MRALRFMVLAGLVLMVFAYFNLTYSKPDRIKPINCWDDSATFGTADSPQNLSQTRTDR